MASCNWKKTENEAGYPWYVDEASGEQHSDHPQFRSIVESLNEYEDIKYSVYRIACKIFALQKQLRVPPLRITSGVFARHQLSLSESSLSLDPGELEAVLADIYFAAEKEGLYTGDVDLAVDLVINLLLNVYDRDRKEPIRVLAAKVLLIILSEEPSAEKWHALANCAADHNGCVSPRRLATLLGYITGLSAYLGVKDDVIQEDVDACFAKSAGMLGVTARSVAEWAIAGCSSARWLPVLTRVQSCRTQATVGQPCAACDKPIVQMLKFKCTKCKEVYFCEKCYLYDVEVSSVGGHKKTHLVNEIIDGEKQTSECLSFMKGVQRFFFCTKTKKKKIKRPSKKGPGKQEKVPENDTVRRRKDGKPAIFTSTVGKASGNNANNPVTILQDIIMQLESQNKALKELPNQLQNNAEAVLKVKIDSYFNEISTQINRLKMLKENLSLSSQNVPTEGVPCKDKPDRMQAFDLFSPIALVQEEKQSKITNDMRTQPRLLSLDSGNFSVVSKNAENLMTMSSDALKPVAAHTSDTLSTMTLDDIGSWFRDTDSIAPDKRSLKTHLSSPPPALSPPPKPHISPPPKPHLSPPPPEFPQSLCVSEQKFEADLRSVASSNDKMKELNADLDTVLDRLYQILSTNFAVDDSCIDNSQFRETANEMEGLLGSLIRGVEQRATLNATKGLV